MTVKELKKQLASLSEDHDNLEIVIKDPNNSGFYGASNKIHIDYCDNDGWQCEEDDKEAVKVLVL
jgi:hypothetical protein